MNNNKQQRLDKLTAEYNDLNGKISRLDAFLNRLDFETTLPDTQEQMLMQHQLQAMRSYRTNLKERIQLLQVQIQAGSPCDDRVVTSAAHHCGQDTRHRDEAAKKLCALLVKGRMAVYAPGKKCNKCGGNLFEGIGTEEGGEIICFNCANQITNEELQQALDEYRAACTHHCGQDATVQDPNESQPANTVPESIKELVGMQIVSAFPPGWKCQGCAYDSDYFRCEKKVELVGGYMLCLAQIPIVTE